MTNRSLALAASSNAARGSTPANNSALVKFDLPEQTTRLLALDVGLGKFSVGRSYDRSDQLRALSNAKHYEFLHAIPALADRAAASLTPVDEQMLRDRLTMLGMSMANGKHPDEVKAWMHETTRLLSDLPQCVLFDAIDECVKEPGRVFCPSVGEIREKAAAPLRRRETHAARLRILANLVAQGVDIPEWQPPVRWGENGPEPMPAEPEPVCTPEQAAEILAEFNLPSHHGERLAAFIKPTPPKSRTEWIADGICPPPIQPDKPETPRAEWDGMA